MQRTNTLLTAVAAVALFFASTGWADVPAPPVNQLLGMQDVALTSLTEADCRVCHDSGVPDRHHLLYGGAIPSPSFVPYPDTDGDGTADANYSCLNCHGPNFVLERNCLECHTSSSHHKTALAEARDCVACHGDLVDNFDDGHYIPTYAPSLVTPTRSQGDGLPLNSRGNGAGACNYCHDSDGLVPEIIRANRDQHHGAGWNDFSSKCGWCHDFGLPFEEQIRVCENCHGPDSLHNIQADSPNVNNVGTIVVGGEDAGWGHVGRDAGAGDSDCWGCHGFAMASAPGTGPIIPSVYGADSAVIDAGTAAGITLSGTAFTNITGTIEYLSDAELTASDGSSVILAPDLLDLGELVVTIPGDTAPGNYDLRAVKAEFASNPAVVSVVPKVSIVRATGDRRVTIVGTGFGGHQQGSGTSVVGTINTANGPMAVEGEIRSWSDKKIRVVFDSRPNDVTVNSVFGSTTSTLESITMGGPAKRRKGTR